MFFYEGLSCPHCHRTFKESDDIVSCPVCGAPHHRGCWGDAGGCACAADHHTDRQWSRDNAHRETASSDTSAKTCPHCGAENTTYAEFCAHCGQEIPSHDWHTTASAQADDPFRNAPPPAGGFGGYHEYTPFHVASPFGGVSPDTDIEGETARDVAAVVGTNTAYYMPRFERMSREKKKVSPNWCALLFTEYWLFYRKQYLMGTLVLALNTMLHLFTVVMMQFFIVAPFEATMQAGTTYTYYDMAQWVANTPSATPIMLLLSLTMLTMWAVKLLFCLFGNAFYLQSCLKAIKRARSHYPEGYQAQLSVYGGTSMTTVLVVFMCDYVFLNLIAGLLNTFLFV